MRGGVALLALFLVSAALGPRLLPRGSEAARPPNLVAYRGLGTWVDLYDPELWERPEAAVQAMKALGVRTLYLETGNYRIRTALFRPRRMDRFLEEAHRLGMRVVAWYLPGFDDLERDFRRSMAAVRHRTPSGQGFDGFALDIEASVVADPAVRTARALRLSERIRAAVGSQSALGAIVPSPRGMELRRTYWPGFPYRELAALYDVFLPMGYFSWRTRTAAGAHDYTARVVRILREQTGDPSVPIHLIGGIADSVDRAEARAFVRAARERGVLGASLYDFATSGSEDWAELRAAPVNPRQSPPLPVPVGASAALGNIPGGDRSHPKEVFFVAGGRAGDWTLRFEAFDVQAGEVRVFVNWRPLAEVAPTPALAWSERRALPVPDALLRDGGPNYVQFLAAGDYPSWSVWGVRAVSLDPAG
ncbi:MAG TPA: hypothetical protein VNO34_06755 [Actinomycetota bacterium]|nr:hypothetical protein [Actinomycetota bacterium]